MSFSSAVVSQPSSSIMASASWVEALLTGSLASSIAVVAVVVLSWRMLAGRVPLVSIGRVALGCFIMFGAPTIALGIVRAAHGDTAGRVVPEAPTKPDVSRNAPAYDPYAGAATPVR